MEILCENPKIKENGDEKKVEKVIFCEPLKFFSYSGEKDEEKKQNELEREEMMKNAVARIFRRSLGENHGKRKFKNY